MADVQQVVRKHRSSAGRLYLNTIYFAFFHCRDGKAKIHSFSTSFESRVTQSWPGGCRCTALRKTFLPESKGLCGLHPFTLTTPSASNVDLIPRGLGATW